MVETPFVSLSVIFLAGNRDDVGSLFKGLRGRKSISGISVTGIFESVVSGRGQHRGI